ncbi:hypothetical protein EYC84_003229 [Monilinia fructicola]|uniref:Serine-rich protein n=1 Tax=Monilinia fructicola TaxID=38448 RepID=A0A5M9JWX7_MONFR|nr:hypothetical protein EYC84_003229 [Monilinia fructicola]
MSNCPAPRRPLHTRSDSETNRTAAVRLVPPESPRLLLEQLENDDDDDDEGEQAHSNHKKDCSKHYDDDKIYSRTPLPTQSAHILSPGNVPGKGQYFYNNRQRQRQSSTSDSGEFHQMPKTPSLSATTKPTSTTTHNTPQITTPATRSSTRPRPQSRKRLVVKVGDGKTFSLVPQDEPQPVEDSRLPSLSTKTSSSTVQDFNNSIISCTNTDSTYTAAPSTITPRKSISADHISCSSSEFSLVGGVRKVPKTPDQKGKSTALDYPLPPLPETSDGQETHQPELSTKPSFLSTTSTATEATNYKVYRHIPESICYESVFTATPTEPNFEILDQSTPSTTIHHPREDSIQESTGSVIHHSREDSIQESTGSVIHHSREESIQESTGSVIHHSREDSIQESTGSVIRHSREDSFQESTGSVIHHSREDSFQESTGSVIHRPRTSQTSQTSSASTSENSNYQILEESISGSVIYRPQHRPQLSTSTSGGYSSYPNSNYQIHEPDTPTSIVFRPQHRPQLSTSTTGDNTNYELYRGRTRDRSESLADSFLEGSFSSGSNYRVHQQSDKESTGSSVIHRPRARAATTSSSEQENYVFHEDLSRSVSLSSGQGPAPKQSQESLHIPTLRTKKKSNDNFGYYKSRSRETLKSKSNHSLRSRANSLASLSTIHTQPDAQRAIVASGSIVHLPAHVQLQKPKGLSSWAELPSPTSPHMNETPHQWSSQLSTVLSVSEGTGTERGSQAWSESMGRRSSAFPSLPSRGSRNMLSISSSHGIEDALARSRSDSMDPPRPAWTRAGRGLSSSSIPVIGDQDEYGDGLTAMQDLRTLQSRNRLSGMFNTAPSDTSRTHTMRSSISSRSNSLLASSIPMWARLYYGSGERRYLPYRPESSSAGTPSRNGSFSMGSGSPNTENFPDELYSPRRRPREGHPHMRGFSQHSIEITPVASAAQGVGRLRTWSLISSVWSPHLRMDRRAARQSVWEPPQINFSTEGGLFGRRNIQVVMFITGFLLPFAWMIAAFLPLPKSPFPEMRERKENAGKLRDTESRGTNDYVREFGPLDEARYESARWWRNLNRWMSAVGLLIIAAIIILAIEGTRKGWDTAYGFVMTQFCIFDDDSYDNIMTQTVGSRFLNFWFTFLARASCILALYPFLWKEKLACWNGMKWNGIGWDRMDWIGLDWIGLDNFY